MPERPGYKSTVVIATKSGGQCDVDEPNTPRIVTPEIMGKRGKIHDTANDVQGIELRAEIKDSLYRSAASLLVIAGHLNPVEAEGGLS